MVGRKAHKEYFFRIAVGITMLLLLLSGGAGALPVEEWNKTFGGVSNDYGYSAQQTSDGGYILAGQKHIAYPSGATGADAWLIKTDANGTEQWNQTYGTGNDIANFARQTSDGGYIAVGWIASSATGVDAWLIKTDANGKEQWNRTYGGLKYDNAYFVQQTSDGGYALVGGTYSFGGTNDAWLIKIDANGTEQWNKTYLANTRAQSIQQTTDGGYIIAGRTYPWGASYNSDAYLLKTDADGKEQWNDTYGREGYEDAAYSIEKTTGSGYIFAGTTSSYGAGANDAWLVKVNDGGTEQWNRTYGGADYDYGYFVRRTLGNGYVLAGLTQSYSASGNKGWLIKVNESGDKLWNMTFGGSKADSINSVQQTSDKGYVLAGSTQSYAVSGNDAWLIKVSGDGTPTTGPVYNINKGTSYITIQAAIDDANPGDEIRVDSGTYYENVNITKQIILKGVDTGEGKPVVDAGSSENTITLSADGSTLEGFDVRNSGWWPYAGIYVISNNNIIKNNTALNHYAGIYLIYSDNNTLSGNNASNNRVGIHLNYSSNNTISGNSALSNGNVSVYLVHSKNNVIIGNSILSSNQGLYFYDSNNNLVYNNYFKNTFNLGFYNNNSINSWNRNMAAGSNIIGGTNLGGNFWANPAGTDFSQTCADSDGDGICDSPYVLDSNNTDYLPLAYKSTLPPTPTPIPIDKKETLGPYDVGHKYYLHIYNVDDIAKAIVNGKQIAHINYLQDSGWIDITDYLTNGSNTIELTEENGIYDGWTYGFEIRQDDSNIIWRDSCGTAGTVACMNGDGTQGLVYRDIITLVITPAPTTSITVTSPNGGEKWQAGTTQTIQWSYTGNPRYNVKIELLKGEVVDSIITSSTPMGSGGSGSYTWTIPSTQISGTDYQIKITSTANSAYTDTSDGHFVISSPLVSNTFGAPGTNPNIPFSFEPVNLATGNYIYQYNDLYIQGRGLPLTITRSYNSLDSYNGSFGYGWAFNYNINLVVTGSENIVAMREDGRRDFYTLNPNGSYTSPSGVYDTLVKNSDGTYTLNRKDQVRYSFTSQGKLNNIIDKNGNKITLTYTGNYLTKVTDSSGRELTLNHDAAGRIISITDPIGRILSYTYDTKGNLIRYSNAMGGEFSYTYDEKHRMTSITDPLGNKIMANTYDEEGRVISQSNALGATYAFNYDVGNRKTTETDPFGKKKIYSYNEQFGELSETDALGNIISYAYDETGNRISITDANGHTIQFSYDINGNIIQIIDPLGNSTSLTYDSKNNLISRTDALGHRTIFVNDANSNIVRVVNALGNATVFTYDEHGQIISGTDANGHTANFGYDTYGNKKTVTDTLGNTVAFGYDNISRLIETTDTEGNKYKFTYDDIDRLISVTDPLGHTETSTYDAVGNRLSFTDPAGNLRTYSYNPLNQLVMVTDALGRTVRYNYDIVGNKVSMIDANGHTTNYAYDPLNRPVSIIDPLGYTTSNTYDAEGNMLSFTNAAGSLTKYYYDPLNRLVKVTDALGGSVNYTYDAVGNMVSMKDANGHITNYIHDPLNRPVSIIDPLGYTTSNTYDAVGNIVSLTDANGKITSYNYDGLNRLIKIVHPDGKTISYSYDARGNRLMMKDSHGTTNYQYDELNRLLNVRNPGGQKVGNTYDAIGNRIQMTYPDGKMVYYAYDSANRLVGITDWKGNITNYAYDTNSNLVSMTYPNGIKTEYTHDKNNRLIKLINKNGKGIISSFEYTLDAVGNRLKVKEQFKDGFSGEPLEKGIDESEADLKNALELESNELNRGNSLVTTYEYDKLNRLNKVIYPLGMGVTYTYDSMGNRLSMNTSIGKKNFAINYEYNAADRLLRAGQTIYAYDSNGNLVEKNKQGRVASYSYDAANRLTSISLSSRSPKDQSISGNSFKADPKEVLINFAYDGDGNRISKATTREKKTDLTKYVLNIGSALPQVLIEADGKNTATYTYGLALISMTDPHDGRIYYNFDGLGSVQSLSDSKGNTKAMYSYDAFGQPRLKIGAIDNDFLFTGEQMDTETGLIYLRARYYDPDIGRFINRDPFQGIGIMTQSLNRYVYTMNNPVNLIDPSGYMGNQIDGKNSVGRNNPVSLVEPTGYFNINSIMNSMDDVNSVTLGIEQFGELLKLEALRPLWDGRYNVHKNVEIIGSVTDIFTVWGLSYDELKQQGITWREIPSIIGDIPMIASYAWENPIEGFVEPTLYGFSSGGAIALNSLVEVIPVNPILRLSGKEPITYTATQEGLSYSGSPILKSTYEWISGRVSELISIPTAYSN